MKNGKTGSKYINASNYSQFTTSVLLLKNGFQCQKSKQKLQCHSLKTD